MPLDLTIIIPTLNEQAHIARAVASVRDLAADVFVVDALSVDNTAAEAESAGATVVSRSWLGHARQKNWALDNLPLRTNWVMFLDADETVPEPLARVLSRVVQSDGDVVAWHVPRRNIFLGRDLQHVWWYPDYQLRIFRQGLARYEERDVHEHMVCDGPSGYLSEPLLHENIKGIEEFLLRHVRYARQEAGEMSKGPQPAGSIGRMPAGAARRRRLLKSVVWTRMPYRPLARFFYLYVVRRGFLDGRQGLVYAQLISAYESMIDAFILEQRLNESGSTRDAA